ncbi:MAG: chemotaxis response regulator protein-glutamate methylesterase [Candidatus Hydrogenedentes bacterium]|nr:chemotaxis response regulator protein-glutamate methylesterase [Candidatus Hydrogenedentota bacterium]
MELRVVVADDAILFRRVMEQVLGSLPGVEVVGLAQNGKIALQKVQELKPDLLTLDMEMPEMDGLAVLDALKGVPGAPAVIVVSALTLHGGRLTLQALQRGAFDFITKPDEAGAEKSRESLRQELTPRVKALSLRLGVRGILRGNTTTTPPSPPAPAIAAPVTAVPARGVPVTQKPEAVLIGVSTGGPNTLATLLPALPPTLGVPVLIVQHMPPLFTQSLAENLDAKCALRVREATHEEIAEPNTVYIAPGGRQMRLAPGPDGRKIIQITDDPPENNCRPAVDYLFRSAAMHFPGRSMAVILTGMGSDGTLGLRLLKRHGCHVIAQDESSSVVWGMPKAAVEAGVTDVVLPLDAIAGKITSLVRGGLP